ncbi:helix-turn-helix transcriptional regulator [Rhodovarius crocodyli]|uniref:Helix-turn-helix transcriptional regulator n=1 Tax=Rhodovarius crocodyli TaxID=1979269 RepID=A0A437MC40_9PROT|nr:S24 family peptidase [Rhodovarius crocodyli]RVT95221.1 helix-turn-helix transcriptional regulator [Rhodovarius crocodyli]
MASTVKAISAGDHQDIFGHNGPMTRLAEVLAARHLQAADLARLTGTDPSTVSKLVRGARELRRHWAEKFAPPLTVRPEDLLTKPGAPIPAEPFAAGSDVQPVATRQPMEAARLPLSAQVPVMGTVSCGTDGQFEVNLTDGPLEYVDVPAKLVGVPDIFALFVAGDSMAGVWAPGDTVYVSRKRPVTPGSYAVVLVEMGQGEQPAAYLKEYVGGDNQRITLRQYNPQTEKVIERARVKEMWRALHWRELL